MNREEIDEYTGLLINARIQTFARYNEEQFKNNRAAAADESQPYKIEEQSWGKPLLI